MEKGGGRTTAPRNGPTREVAVRLALVDEFRTRSKIFISTAPTR
jgi:hypothetical protein